MERDETGTAQGRPVPPALPGRAVLPPGPRARARRAPRLPPVAHARQGRVRDEGRARLQAPDRDEFDPRDVRQPRRRGSSARRRATAEVLGLRAHRLAGRAPLRPLRRGPPGDDGSIVFATPYANARMLASWVLRLRRARPGPRPARAGGRGRRARRDCSPRATPTAASSSPRPPTRASCPTPTRTRTPRAAAASGDDRDPPGALRAPRHARVASSSRPAGAASCSTPPSSASACRSPTASCARTSTSSTSSTSAAARTSSTPRSPRTGTIEVDPEPYADNFARPARLLPVEAKALVAAIDLIGEHLPEGALTSAREKIVAALGEDPTERGLQVASAGGDDSAIARVVSEAIAAGRTAAARLLQAQRGRVRPADDRAVRAHERARGLVRRLVRPRARRRPPLPARPHPQRGDDRRDASRAARRSIRRPTSTAGRAPAR